MARKLAVVLLLWPVLVLLSAGCDKFKMPAVKMPKFRFVTTENLHSVACVGDNVWISGSYGTVMHSSDGGAKWTKQKTGVEGLLCCMSFADEKDGWVAGVKGVILHTSDGGKTWVRQQSGTENNFMDMFFLDNRNGWVVGEFGTILHTSDGGKTWKPQMKEQDTIYNDVFFADENNGWVVGEFGTILRTSDAGRSWQHQHCKDIVPVTSEMEWERPLPALYGIFFTDNETGWIVGMEGVIITTHDGGNTWKKIPSGTDKPLYSIQVNGSRAWVVGNKGAYLMSIDGGKTWEARQKAIKTKFWLRDVSFCDGKNGFIVGARGTIAVSKDGGDNWELISGFSYDMKEFGLSDF